MNGQATIEALLSFALALVIMSVIASSLVSQNQSIRSKETEISRVNKAEAAARAVETYLNSGFGMRFGFNEENISYRVENDRFFVDLDGRTIEVKGVFAHDN
jgi:hypothetical protein